MHTTETVGRRIDELAARLNEEEELREIIELLRPCAKDTDVGRAIRILEGRLSICRTAILTHVDDIKRVLAGFDEQYRRERVFLVEMLQRAHRAYPTALGKAPRMALKPYRARGPRRQRHAKE